MGRAFGIVAIIFGIFSIPFCVLFVAISTLSRIQSSLLGIHDILAPFFIIGWLIPAIAIIFGIIGIIADKSKGLAITGLILGSLALIFGLLVGFMFTNLFSELTP